MWFANRRAKYRKNSRTTVTVVTEQAVTPSLLPSSVDTAHLTALTPTDMPKVEACHYEGDGSRLPKAWCYHPHEAWLDHSKHPWFYDSSTAVTATAFYNSSVNWLGLERWHLKCYFIVLNLLIANHKTVCSLRGFLTKVQQTLIIYRPHLKIFDFLK